MIIEKTNLPFHCHVFDARQASSRSLCLTHQTFLAANSMGKPLSGKALAAR
jgi:hypothetical protein